MISFNLKNFIIYKIFITDFSKLLFHFFLNKVLLKFLNIIHQSYRINLKKIILI